MNLFLAYLASILVSYGVVRLSIQLDERKEDYEAFVLRGMMNALFIPAANLFLGFIMLIMLGMSKVVVPFIDKIFSVLFEEERMRQFFGIK